MSYALKANWKPNSDHHLMFAFSHSDHAGWEPWAAKRAVPVPEPKPKDIKKYGLEIAQKRLLVDRANKDESYSLKYRFNPSSEPLIDLNIKLAYALTSQKEERHPTASVYSLGNMENKNSTVYKDINLEVSNTSSFDMDHTSHDLTLGLQYNHMIREVEMFNKKYKDKKPKKQTIQLWGFYPSFHAIWCTTKLCPLYGGPNPMAEPYNNTRLKI